MEGVCVFTFFYVFFLVYVFEFYYFVLNINSLIHTIFDMYLVEVVVLDGVLYFVFGKNKQLNNCFGKTRLALIRAYC